MKLNIQVTVILSKNFKLAAINNYYMTRQTIMLQLIKFAGELATT